MTEILLQLSDSEEPEKHGPCVSLEVTPTPWPAAPRDQGTLSFQVGALRPSLHLRTMPVTSACVFCYVSPLSCTGAVLSTFCGLACFAVLSR